MFKIPPKKNNKKRILFLLKKNNSYGSYGAKSGLLNSCLLLGNSLKNGNLIEDYKIDVCIDGNSVDRALSEYKPDIAFIEALWVTPSKLIENIKLHPNVKFVIRIHSNIPFLSMEGMAMTWIKEYDNIPGVEISFNNKKTFEFISPIIKSSVYLPNLYTETPEDIECFKDFDVIRDINIGCFGAIRPLKNQLIQAVAAINYGDRNNKDVQFHINSSRVEQRGENVLKNLRALFSGTRHTLVEHDWMTHEDFLKIIDLMHVGLQVSFSESFNIVTADFVKVGVPIIVSDEISWMNWEARVNPTDADDMSERIELALCRPRKFVRKARKSLFEYNNIATGVWMRYFKDKRVNEYLCQR